ncbi:MAG: hypothetical protein AAF493_09870, partial [Pseudomonadota bacterium]
GRPWGTSFPRSPRIQVPNSCIERLPLACAACVPATPQAHIDLPSYQLCVAMGPEGWREHKRRKQAEVAQYMN